MSEMVERVARAIFPEAEDYTWDDFANAPNGSAERITASVYRMRARAAIEAMREPTEAMVHAGMSEEGTDLPSEYRAMIDAALS
jgi:hypothetical protein